MKINISTVKAADIFPIMGVYGGVAVSVRGVLTVGWELVLPEIYSMEEADYDGCIEALASAVRVLPPWTVVHRQDRYYSASWQPGGEARSFLGRASDRHFSGRPYLEHSAYVFVSFGTSACVDKGVERSGIFGLKGWGTPPDAARLQAIRAKCDEFVHILSGAGFFKLRLLDDSDWLGTPGGDPGIIHTHMMLGDRSTVLSDVDMRNPESVRVRGLEMNAFTIGESSQLPGEIGSVLRVDALSGDERGVSVSFGAMLGALLPLEHEVNQYILVPPQQDVLQKLDRKRKDMTAGISSADNRLNAGEVMAYLDATYAQGLFTVLSHVDLQVWGEPGDMTGLDSAVSASLSAAGIQAVLDRHDTANVWYSSIPGNACELGMENFMTMELYSALCLGCWETFDRGFDRGTIRLCDRTRNVPLHVDTQEEAERRGFVKTYNKFVVGGSGTGKSFYMNNDLRGCYDAGETVFVIDVGDSYEGLTNVIREESGGRDGQYISWDAEHPLSFNLFSGFTKWLDASGNLNAEAAGVNFAISFLKTLWSPEKGWAESAAEPVLKQTVTDFVRKALAEGKDEEHLPLLDDYYTYLGGVWMQISKGRYKVGEDVVGPDIFDLKRFRLSLKAYSKGGEFGYFMNDPHPADVFSSRWTVFEVDKLSQVEDGKFYSLVILAIMNAFDRKMRELPGVKVMVIEEAWKAIANETMAPYLRGLWKTARKFSTSAVVVTQEVTDITSSEVIKDAILANSDTRVLLDQRNNRGILTDESTRGRENDLRTVLGLTPKDVSLLLSLNRDNDPEYNYREVFVKYVYGPSNVYATEVSPEEAACYESNKQKKARLLSLAKEKGSFIEAVKAVTGRTD